MKATAVSSAFLLISILSAGQPETEWQKKIETLQLKVRQLENENRLLIAENRATDSLAYCALRKDIFDVFSNESQLLFDFRSTSDKIALTGLFTRLMIANNPSSDILGFRFNEIILASAEKHFRNALENESDKRRFSKTISNIINNPVVTSLANTNPITSVVASIISTIVGFTTTSICVDKEGGRVKDISVGQQEAFDNTKLQSFIEEMQVYIIFYDRLIAASDNYLQGLTDLNYKYSSLMFSVSNYLDDLHSTLILPGGNVIMDLAQLLPDPSSPGINFSALLQNEAIQHAAGLSGKYEALKMSVSDFRYEYHLLLSDFLSDYIAVLETSKEFPDNSIDISCVDRLINEIRQFIREQNLDEIPWNDNF